MPSASDAVRCPAVQASRWWPRTAAARARTPCCSCLRATWSARSWRTWTRRRTTTCARAQSCSWARWRATWSPPAPRCDRPALTSRGRPSRPRRAAVPRCRALRGPGLPAAPHGRARQVRAIVATLVEVLATPSSSVQTAVSACLTPLMPGLAADRAFTDGLVQAMLKRLLQGQSYGDRWATRAAPCTLPAALAETAPVQGMQGVRHEGAVGGVCHHSLPHLSAVQARRGPGAGGHREGPGYQRHQRLRHPGRAEGCHGRPRQRGRAGGRSARAGVPVRELGQARARRLRRDAAAQSGRASLQAMRHTCLIVPAGCALGCAACCSESLQ